MSDIQQSEEALKDLLLLVRERFGAIEFGTLQLVFHNGRLVQVEETRRTRFDRPS